MITRLPIDLSIVRAAPGESFPTGSASSIRFHVVPGPFIVRLNGGEPIEVEHEFSIDFCTQPLNQIAISNEEGSGTAIILLSDGNEKFHDFMAPAGVFV